MRFPNSIHAARQLLRQRGKRNVRARLNARTLDEHYFKIGVERIIPGNVTLAT
jgi:hypothetical protein